MAVLLGFAALTSCAAPPRAVVYDATVPGPLSLVATYQSIGVYAPFSGDENENNRAALEWRPTGAGTWRPGMEMTVDRRPTVSGGPTTVENPFRNQWRASVLGLEPGARYDVRVRFTDPDGVNESAAQAATVVTRNDVVSLATGAEYYVSPAGDDANAGSVRAPFRTIQRAVDAARPGDSVTVLPGRYAAGAVVADKMGTPTAYVTIQAAYGALRADSRQRAVIDGGAAGNAFVVQDSRYVLIEGFEIANVADTAGTPGAIRVDRSPDVVVRENRVTGFNYNGIRLEDSPHATLEGNTVQRTKGPPGTGEAHLISIWQRAGLAESGGYVVRRNLVHDLSRLPRGAQPWDCIGGGPAFAADGFAGRDTDIYENAVSGCTDDGIEVAGGNVNVRVWDNVVRGTHNGIAASPVMVGPLYVFRNLVHRSTAAAVRLGQQTTGQSYFYHNTFYVEGATGVFIQSGGLSNVTARNNIVRAGMDAIDFATPGAGASHSFDYDAVVTADAHGRFAKWGSARACCATLEEFQAATGNEANGLSVDAAREVMDASSGDFRLIRGSQLRDRGMVLPGFNDPSSAWPYLGSAPDLGAYEGRG